MPAQARPHQEATRWIGEVGKRASDAGPMLRRRRRYPGTQRTLRRLSCWHTPALDPRTTGGDLDGIRCAVDDALLAQLDRDRHLVAARRSPSFATQFLTHPREHWPS
jgi:hypothetical protein